ncbi:MAG: TolC family protein [Epsilonproteobacteria bacterium]|nr:TolC family protein [Campylobacterota bacterium]
MQLRISKYVSLFLLLGGTLFGSEILSEAQKSSLELQKEKAVQDSESTKYQWLNPLTYAGSYQNGSEPGDSLTSKISISQPIFKSGGIESTMRYADNIKSSSTISIEMQKKTLIKTAYNLAYNIKKVDLQIVKQKLSLDNAKIDLRIKKESVTNGLLDISFLNNAILTKNSLDASLLDFEFNKINLINSFKNISTLDPYKVELPVLSKINGKDFDEKNLEVLKTQIDIESKKNLEETVGSNYKPSIVANGSYTYDHKSISNIHPKDLTASVYGVSVVIPLDYNYYAKTGSLKADYLKSKQDLEILKTKETNFFKIQEFKIAMLESKLSLTKENISIYNDLLAQNKELASVGIKTLDDVQVIQNSRDSELLNLKIFEIEKQLELLEIYGKIENATV